MIVIILLKRSISEICSNNFNIKLFKEVSSNRNSTAIIKNQQSIHYTGFNINNKKQCIQEYNTFFNKIHL